MAQPKVCGVYAIVSPSGRRYIGSAADIRARWAHHRNALRRGDHANRALQRAYAKYGSALVFTVIDICAVAEVLVREQAHIDASDPAKLYNATLRVEAFMRGRKFTEEHKARIRQKAIGRGHTDETRAKMRGPRDSEALRAHARKVAETLRGVPRKDISVGKSGLRGVYPTSSGTWLARVGVGAARREIGTYRTRELALWTRFVYIECLGASK